MEVNSNMGNNNNLLKAKSNKNDEFYTRYDDISNELIRYKSSFYNKIVYCNCDFPTKSEFWNYFHKNFSNLGLKKLICTFKNWNSNAKTFGAVYTGGDDEDIFAGDEFYLDEDGSFESDECISILKDCDIVVTNPPFSLLRSYISLLFKYNKTFIILGNQNVISTKDVFPLFISNKITTGYETHSHCRYFNTPDGRTVSVGGVCWLTNIRINKNFDNSIFKTKHENELNGVVYKYYDNYDALNVDKVAEIPIDYNGVLGVPLTFIHKYDKDLFEILGLTNSTKSLSYCLKDNRYDTTAVIDGKEKYVRLLIKRR